MEIHPYDPEQPGEADALWRLKRAFELELGSATGSDDKQAAYEGKLDAEYRERYLEWVARCVADEPRSVTVVQLPPAACGGGKVFVGYAFVLPERLAMVWDAAVLNELYVDPDHRGTGLADQLMDAVLEVARSQQLPLDRLVLDVDPANDRAGAFYERHGFEHWGEMVARDL